MFLQFVIFDNFVSLVLVLHVTIELFAFIIQLIGVAVSLSFCFRIVTVSRFSVGFCIKQEPEIIGTVS
jgi:hypothetical protein